MALLGSRAIRQALEDGRITCDPMPETIEGVHIDVHLHCDYWVPRVPWHLRLQYGISLVLPGLVPQPAVHLASNSDAHDWYERRQARDGSLLIPPNASVLARTVEAIGSNSPDIQPILITRSTLARWGFSSHTSAGWGDPGFDGVWTLEIVNHHPLPRSLPVGIRIGCIAFEEVVDNDTMYQGRYKRNREAFVPDDMLPRRGNLL